MKRLIISVILAMVLLLLPASGVFAASTATVNVTAQPSLISITISPGAWVINGITGSGGLDIGTIYYSQKTQTETTIFGEPVSAANVEHTVTNTSTVNIALKADMADFSDSTANMTNGNGTAAAGVFAAWVSAADGVADWSTAAVAMDATGSGTFWTSSSPGDNIEVAFAVETQTDAWTDYTPQTTTILLTATAA